MGVDYARPSRLAVLLYDGLQLPLYDGPDPAAVFQNVLQVRYLRLQLFDVLQALEDVLLVYVPQLYLRHEFRLDLVDAKAYHEVWHDLPLLLRLADDADGLVDVQEYLPQAL